MPKKFLSILFLLFLTTNSFAQIDKFWIYGKVTDSTGVVKDVNIVNLKTKLGTFTNDFGDYKIIVSIGDTLEFTSVQHEKITRVINNFIYSSEILNVYLSNADYILDEVVLQRHDLSGYMDLDRKRTPVNRRYLAMKKALDFSNVDMSADSDLDVIDQHLRPMLATSDPTMRFVGAGAAIVMPFKYSERLWALRKKMKYKSDFPFMLISEFGEKFFESDLKIPVERYFHFLEYCNPLGIEDMYKQGKKIEMINILRAQSKSYLALIKDSNEE